ncbi:hypothetical protein BGP_0046 [Beggiatoa sp. PS]|nr:hypothetical protein BGP_0046 [Beggiatoa sp. PS]
MKWFPILMPVLLENGLIVLKGKKLPDYGEIAKLHEKFHQEAAQVLSLALMGRPSTAIVKMQEGSPFSQLSAKLIDKLTHLNKKIGQEIATHNIWKFHLKNAIETGRSHFTVEEVKNYHACVFGEWLDSAEGKRLPHYLDIIELHKKFHEEASIVLRLALMGQPSEAIARMREGSLFSQISSQLIEKLTDIEEF